MQRIHIQNNFKIMLIKCFKIILITLGISSTFLLCTANAVSFDLKIQNNKISIDAHKVPLQKILERIADLGIWVYTDPEINPNITASFKNRDLEDGLKSLFKSVSHVLIWEPFKNNSNDHMSNNFKLVEIKIFRKGRNDLMVPLVKSASDNVFSQEYETKVIIKQDKVFIPVILGLDNKEVETSLVFDTGANSIVIHENIADELGVSRFIKSKAIGIGGTEIDAKAIRLDYVKVGPNQKTNLSAHVIEYKGSAMKYYNGVLGMNFLKGIEYYIDFEENIIRWRK